MINLTDFRVKSSFWRNEKGCPKPGNQLAKYIYEQKISSTHSYITRYRKDQNSSFIKSKRQPDFVIKILHQIHPVKKHQYPYPDGVIIFRGAY